MLEDNLTVQVPAQNKLFTMYNAVNYGSYPDPVEDDHKFWFTTSDNLFKSLNFSKGISSFYSGNIGEWGTIDYVRMY